jgi:hypothetical protein
MTFSNPGTFDRLYAAGTVQNLARKEYQDKGSLKREIENEIARLEMEVEDEERLQCFETERKDRLQRDSYIRFLTCQITLLKTYL